MSACWRAQIHQWRRSLSYIEDPSYIEPPDSDGDDDDARNDNDEDGNDADGNHSDGDDDDAHNDNDNESVSLVSPIVSPIVVLAEGKTS